MEIVKKCKTCKKELTEFEGNMIPTYMPPSVNFRLPSAGYDSYCDKCYKDATGESAKEELKKIEKNSVNDKKTKNIRELKLNTNDIVEAKVTSCIKDTVLNQNGKDLKLKIFEIQDITGSIQLILWGDKAEEVSVGKKYIIFGYIKEYAGNIQITLGKRGYIKEK